MHLAELTICVPAHRLEDVGKYLSAQQTCPVKQTARPAPTLTGFYLVRVEPQHLDPECVLEFRKVAMYLLGML